MSLILHTNCLMNSSVAGCFYQRCILSPSTSVKCSSLETRVSSLAITIHAIRTSNSLIIFPLDSSREEMRAATPQASSVSLNTSVPSKRRLNLWRFSSFLEERCAPLKSSYSVIAVVLRGFPALSKSSSTFAALSSPPLQGHQQVRIQTDQD